MAEQNGHTDLGGYLLDRLEPEERERFEAHLEDCVECREESRSLEALVGMLPVVGHAVALPPALGARVVAAVEREAARDPAPRRAPAARARPTWRRLLVPALAATTLALGAFLLGGRVGGADDPSGPLELAAVLVPPGGGASRARAEVVETGIGRVVTFDTDDLPILPKGEFYELWFVGPGDRNRISAGTFHPDPEGRSSVRFAAAVDPARYPVLSVTREPGDGDPAPSGDEVLRSAPPR